MYVMYLEELKSVIKNIQRPSCIPLFEKNVKVATSEGAVFFSDSLIVKECLCL